VKRFVSIVETTAGYFIGLLALITVIEAALRYIFRTHIPDGFVLGQLMQGIAICWGIGTATYADRHISVDVVYLMLPSSTRRAFDIFGYTLLVFFMLLFAYGTTYKVFDSMQAGDVSADLHAPMWAGYVLASLGVIAATFLACLRWWQFVFLRR
jgi:TRAP-type C4-dicarboxylate transport system permease small subunit